jgi:universal stress protein A
MIRRTSRGQPRGILLALAGAEGLTMIALKRILVPHDFSETSAAAVTYAVALARHFGAELSFLHVGDRNYSETRDVSPIHDALLAILSPSDRLELNPAFYVKTGFPAAEIVRFASDGDIDLIVMGTHGRGFIGHALMGSVAESVVRTAPCPVLTVRNPHAPQRVEVVAEAVDAARVAV